MPTKTVAQRRGAQLRTGPGQSTRRSADSHPASIGEGGGSK
jgi:hypothetical protein